MAFTNYEDFLAAKKKMDTYDIRVSDNSLTVDAAYDILVGDRVRDERNARLAATDFRVVNDAPWDTTPWISYRQELRDIPESAGFPHEVVWPTEPTA